jgi:hypothetical protein
MLLENPGQTHEGTWEEEKGNLEDCCALREN